MIKQMEQQTLFNSTCFRIICVRQFRILTVMWYLTGIFYGKKQKTKQTKQNKTKRSKTHGLQGVDCRSHSNAGLVVTSECSKSIYK